MDSANKRGSLLEVVQVLNDLNLIVRRAYISSDGEWFMDGKLCCTIVVFLLSKFYFFVTKFLVLNCLFQCFMSWINREISSVMME